MERTIGKNSVGAKYAAPRAVRLAVTLPAEKLALLVVGSCGTESARKWLRFQPFELKNSPRGLSGTPGSAHVVPDPVSGLF